MPLARLLPEQVDPLDRGPELSEATGCAVTAYELRRVAPGESENVLDA
ncbi:hypothetical protein [Parasphingorhabdus pacifica]